MIRGGIRRMVFAWSSVAALAACASPQPPTGARLLHVDATEAAALLKEADGIVVLDVRTPWEFRRGHLAGARNVNALSPRFGARLDELDPADVYLVHCRSGHRSGRVPRMLAERGVETVYHLDGGLNAWRRAGLPVVRD